MEMSLWRVIGVITLSGLLGSNAFAAPDPVAACQADKLRAAGEKAQDKLKCHAHAQTKGEPVDPACLAKAEATFEKAFAKAEEKTNCPGDPATVETIVDDCVAAVLGEVTLTSKLVFVSSATYTGNLGGLAGADAKCQQLADAAGLGGAFKAWLSDSNTDAKDRLTHATVPYVLVNGLTVASNFTDLTDGSLTASINKSELNGTVGDVAWTGTDFTGTACFKATSGACALSTPTPSDGGGIPRQACLDWTSIAGIGEAVVGLPGSTSTSWTSDGDRRCSDTHHLYCLQQ